MKKKICLVSLILVLSLVVLGCAYPPSENIENLNAAENYTMYSEAHVAEPPLPGIEHFPGGDLWIRTDLDGVLISSTDIIRGEILSSWTEEINILLTEETIVVDGIELGLYIHTVYNVKVLEVFSGNTQVGDIVQVKQLGGVFGERTLSYSGFVRLNIGDELILFLTNYNYFGFGYFPLGLAAGMQSVYRFPLEYRNVLDVSIEAAFSQNHLIYDVALENLSPYNPITVTVGDLLRILNASDRELDPQRENEQDDEDGHDGLYEEEGVPEDGYDDYDPVY